MAAFRISISVIFFLMCCIIVAAQRSAVIDTEPSASVWLNGVFYGKTDASGKLEIKNVPAGVQKIKVRADGFKEISKPLVAGNNSITLVKTTDGAELAFQEAERLAAEDEAES